MLKRLEMKTEIQHNGETAKRSPLSLGKIDKYENLVKKYYLVTKVKLNNKLNLNIYFLEKRLKNKLEIVKNNVLDKKDD